jgi:hypothetical protein
MIEIVPGAIPAIPASSAREKRLLPVSPLEQNAGCLRVVIHSPHGAQEPSQDEYFVLMGSQIADRYSVRFSSPVDRPTSEAAPRFVRF